MDDPLLVLLGPSAFLALVENFGGERLYVAKSGTPKLAAAIGAEAAQKLSRRYGGEHPLIPLARAFRAQHYRAAGDSNPQIARKLGLTVRGVERLLKADPEKASRRRTGPQQQMSFFD